MTTGEQTPKVDTLHKTQNIKPLYDAEHQRHIVPRTLHTLKKKYHSMDDADRAVLEMHMHALHS